MSRKQESGQVFVLAALAMMVLIAIAALCVNASFMFYQHQRMQAQVDEQTRLAAGSGCTVVPNATNNGSFDGGTLAITPTTFFGQQGHYCDGVLTKSPGGLFGRILRFPNKISVHAVAEHGGSFEEPFAFLGLDTDPGNNFQDCSVLLSGNNSVSVTGNILVNSTKCTDHTQGSGTLTLIPPYQYLVAPPRYDDPFEIQVPTSGGSPISSSCGGSCITYTASITGVTLLPNSITGDVYLNPNGSTPGVFLVPGTFNPSVLKTVNSVVILESSASLPSSTLSSNDWDLHSPTSGDYTGYAIYQATPCTSIASLDIAGSAKFSYEGLLDLSCTNVKIQGNGTDTFNGGIVANTIKLLGNSSGTAFKPSRQQPARGAFLVQ